ncbi:MAG: YraN family protein [Spirochaetes bacterium]|nr:YraN family protein [Spirochaetota bacterium]
MSSEKSSGYRKDFGDKGEEIAASFLQKNGFEIIIRNYRFSKAGEIDIIARKGNLIIFAEVKSRNSGSYGGAYYSITEKKKQTIKKVARQFLHVHPAFFSKDMTYRFDMIAVDNNRAEWIEDIFR